MISRSEGICGYGWGGVVDGDQKGGYYWTGGWKFHNLQSTAVYVQLSTRDLVTLPQEFTNISFYLLSFNLEYSSSGCKWVAVLK